MAKQPLTLQEWMDRNGLVDAGLSARLGGKPTRSQISRIRRGKSIPTIETARALEAVTKIPAVRFVMSEA